MSTLVVRFPEWVWDTLTVNGRDVWAESTHIELDGERPVAARVYVRDAEGKFYLRRNPDTGEREVAASILTGDIRVTGLRRRRAL